MTAHCIYGISSIAWFLAGIVSHIDASRDATVMRGYGGKPIRGNFSPAIYWYAVNVLAAIAWVLT